MSRHTRLLCRVACGLIVTVISAAALAAQHLDSLPVGSRISVTLSDSVRQFVFERRLQEMRGTLTLVTPDSLYLRVGPSTPFAIARSDVRGLFVTRGVRRGPSALRTGTFIALIAAFSAQREERFSIQALQVGGGFAFGAALGAIWPFESWKRVRK